MADDVPRFRTAVNIGLAVALACAVVSFVAMNWARRTYVPADDWMGNAMVALTGMPLGVLSGGAGYLAGRCWWRRALRRRTIDR